MAEKHILPIQKNWELEEQGIIDRSISSTTSCCKTSPGPLEETGFVVKNSLMVMTEFVKLMHFILLN